MTLCSYIETLIQAHQQVLYITWFVLHVYRPLLSISNWWFMWCVYSSSGSRMDSSSICRTGKIVYIAEKGFQRLKHKKCNSSGKQLKDWELQVSKHAWFMVPLKRPYNCTLFKAVLSFIEMAQYLLSLPGVTVQYILSEKLCQDSIEAFFPLSNNSVKILSH